MNNLKKIFLFIFNIGWLVPMFVSFYLLFQWFDTDVSRVVYEINIAGNNFPFLYPGNSFPFLYYAKKSFFIAFFWMSAVVVFWSYKSILKTKPHS